MRKVPALIVLVVAALLSALFSAPPTMAASVGNSAPQTGQIVNEDPANFTPHILNGTVYSIVQVGNMVVVGGDFTQVRQTATSAILTRNRLFAFNAATGEISSDFNPNPNSTVFKVQAAMDGTSVYVGGRFSAAYGVSMPSRLFKADVTSGARDATFRPGTISGDIRDLEVIGNRLWVAGKFTHIAGVAQKALGTINATTGVRDSYFTGLFAGTHRDPTVYTADRTNVLQITTNPANNRLVAVGNFTSVNGVTRSQIAQFDIGGASYSLTSWYTTLFTSSCSRNFETIMTDVEYSPNGSFFVVSTTAAWGGMSSAYGGNGCDVVARFESSSTSSNSKATWTAYTGGDSTWTVEVTDNVVYAGGHQSWQNNPIGANVAAQGAVSRPGIAALNAVNGMAWSWNPTRTRGVGVQDMLATPQGLWVGSDTDRFGQNYEYHGNIAFLPLTGGKTLPAMSNPALPATVYSVAAGGSQLTRREFNGGTSNTAPTAVSPGGTAPAWGSTVGAFMSNGMLYTAASNGTITKRTFNGSTYGSPSVVDTADQLAPQTDWHDTDVPSLTSLFFYDGEMFFTRSGQTTMFRRGFEPESDIVGQQRFTIPAVSGMNFSNMRGAFVANDKFYFATSTGRMYRADWSNRSPVANTVVQVSGPDRDNQNWASRALFTFEGAATEPENQAPTAAATASCANLVCSFNGTASTDPDGDTLTYEWDFDDDTANGTGATTTHTYDEAFAGSRTVTLTVKDPDGLTASTTRTITPQVPANQAPTAAATISCVLLDCTFDATASNDPDGSIDSYAWNFGDTQTGTGVTTTHTYGEAGGRTVTLTVTDNAGAIGTETFPISPTDGASPIEFVAATGLNGNRADHTLTIPNSVQAGDALVLFFAANTTTPTYTGPAGWTQIEGTNTGIVARAYTKVATAADAGAVVRVTSSAYAKADMEVAVYRGTDPSDPVAVSASGQDAGGTTHTSPTLTAPAGNNTLLTYWADKSNDTSAWTAPAGQTRRNSKFGTGSGHMSGLITDQNGVTGTTGGLTATANASSSRGVSFSVVLH